MMPSDTLNPDLYHQYTLNDEYKGWQIHVVEFWALGGPFWQMWAGKAKKRCDGNSQSSYAAAYESMCMTINTTERLTDYFDEEGDE